MKKLILFIFCLLILSSCVQTCDHDWVNHSTLEETLYKCTLCGKSTTFNVGNSVRVSEDIWNKLNSRENYKNFTVEVSKNYSQLGESYVYKYKVTKDIISVTTKFDGLVIREPNIYSIEQSEYYKQYFELFLSKYLEYYDDFKFDSENGYYTGKYGHNYLFLIKEDEKNIFYKISVANGIVTLDDKGRLLKIEGNFSETIKDDYDIFSQRNSYVEMSFYDFNTTEITNEHVQKTSTYLSKFKEVEFLLPVGFKIIESTDNVVAVSQYYPLTLDNIALTSTTKQDPSLCTATSMENAFKNSYGDIYRKMEYFKAYSINDAIVKRATIVLNENNNIYRQYIVFVFTESNTYCFVFTFQDYVNTYLFEETINSIRIIKNSN